MKILVTGADGFIGSHLVEELVKKGKNVKAFCNYNSFGKHGWIETIDKKVVKDIEIISGDVRDPWCIQKNMKGCDKVFHLAALIGIPYSYLATSEYVETNITGAATPPSWGWWPFPPLFLPQIKFIPIENL